MSFLNDCPTCKSKVDLPQLGSKFSCPHCNTMLASNLAHIVVAGLLLWAFIITPIAIFAFRASVAGFVIDILSGIFLLVFLIRRFAKIRVVNRSDNQRNENR